LGFKVSNGTTWREGYVGGNKRSPYTILNKGGGKGQQQRPREGVEVLVTK